MGRAGRGEAGTTILNGVKKIIGDEFQRPCEC